MLTIAIPTYERGAVLCDTIAYLLALEPRANEIVIVDQTPKHPSEVDERLRRYEREGAVRIIRLEKPSIPRAMNTALAAAKSAHVLFLDDDIIPARELVGAHSRAAAEAGMWAVAG